MAKNIRGGEWLEFLGDKGVFNSIFSNEYVSSDFDDLWANWLVEKFVGSDDDAIKRLLIKNKRRINSSFANKLAMKLCAYTGNQVNDSYFSEYIVLLEKHKINSFTIMNLIVRVK